MQPLQLPNLLSSAAAVTLIFSYQECNTNGSLKWLSTAKNRQPLGPKAPLKAMGKHTTVLGRAKTRSKNKNFVLAV